MEKFFKIILFLLIKILALNGRAYSQSFSESDIKNFANQANDKLSGLYTSDGITVKGCFSIGRTIIYQYDVPSNWEPSVNIKEELIANLKTVGTAKTFFLNDVNVSYYYYKRNLIVKKVNINSNDLSTFKFELLDYLSIKGHEKSKGVNLKLKVPQGWAIEEGDRPNIVKKFTNDVNTYSILIKENMTFFSRSEIRELFSDENIVDDFVRESSSSMKSLEIIDKSVVTIDTYPSITFKVRGKIERLGITIPIIMRSWIVFYEDRIVFLQANGLDNAEFQVLERLYFLITSTVIFPDQYN